MDNKQSFKIDVFGHQWAIDLLKRQHAADRVSQSLLLTGPLNVGKGTLARFFAQYLDCQDQPKPCGQCRSCRKVISGNHPDVRILDDDQQALKIDQIRELQHELSLSPVEGPYRVAVLGNFERATAAAANALLKTLEEPARQVVIILTAPDPGNLLPTIVSRCQMLTLRALPVSVVQETLVEQWHAPAEKAELLAQLSAGRLGWAVRALTDDTFLERRAQHLLDLQDLLQMHQAERLAFAQEMSRDSGALRETLVLWLTVWRDVLLLMSGSQTKIVNLDWHAVLASIARSSSIEQATEMVVRLRTALLDLDKNVNSRLISEVVLLKLPKYANVG